MYFHKTFAYKVNLIISILQLGIAVVSLSAFKPGVSGNNDCEVINMAVKIARIYDAKEEKGVRVLTDRVWPRGVSKEDANLDHWLKEVAPTSDLRKWFNHDPQLFGTFKEKYEKELRENDDQKEAFEELKQIVKESKQDVLLLFAAKDTEHNQAVILKDLLDNQ